jgi:hypothetical protein
MKQINATPAAIEIAADEMKQTLNEIAPAERTEELWNSTMKRFGRQFIAAAFPEVNTPLNLIMWLSGAKI